MNKRNKSYLKIFLAIISVFALCSFALIGEVPTISENEYAKKIDAKLMDVMNNAAKDELIPINVSLKDVDETAIWAAFKQDTGFDFTILQNEKLFNEQIGYKIISSIEAKIGEYEAHKRANVEDSNYRAPSPDIIEELRGVLNNELKEFIDDPEEIIDALEYDRSISITDYAILQARQSLQAARLDAVKPVITAANNAFIAEYVGKKDSEIVYASTYIPAIFMKATKQKILEMASATETVYISYNDPGIVFEPQLSVTETQVGVDETTGTKSGNFNNGLGFWGTGIRIGVIEASGVISTSSPHYSSSRMTEVSNGSVLLPVCDHASLVTSIIAGNKVVFKSARYSGVVPYSKVFYTRGNTVANLFSGLDALAANNVNVINLSLGVSSNAYNSIDRDLDKFINNTGIVCVCAAGNDGSGTTRITSPGYALNCITVGNLQTKVDATTVIPAPNSLHVTSSWEEPNNTPNKPDICAPGTFISAVKTTSGTVNYYFDLGTSFAAPFVTGVVAQMMQQHPAKIGNPIAVKAKIMNTANRYVVSTDNNDIQGYHFVYEKSGAGMVDAKKSMSGTAYIYAWNHQAVEPNYITQLTINLSAGQRMRATLAFSNKNTNDIIDDSTDFYDMDLRIVDASTGEALATSTSTRNNVEIIDYTTSTARTVYVQTRIYRNLSSVKTDWALEVDKW